MSKLEDRILKKVYIHETKRTSSEVFVRIITLLLVGFTILVVGSTLYQILSDQGTFDLFGIFQEDFDVIKVYFFEVVTTFYQETPKLHLFLLLFVTAGFLILFVLFIKNLKKISRRIQALSKYWFGKKR